MFLGNVKASVMAKIQIRTVPAPGFLKQKNKCL